MEREAHQSSEAQKASPVEAFILDETTLHEAHQPALHQVQEEISRDTLSNSGSKPLPVDSEPQKLLRTDLLEPSEHGDTKLPSRSTLRDTFTKSAETQERKSSDSGRIATGGDPSTAKSIRRQAWLPKSKTPDELVLKGPQLLKLSDEATSMKHAIEIIMLAKISQRRDAEAHFRCPRIIRTWS